MIESVVCKQEKALKGKILSNIMLGFSLVLFLVESIPLFQKTIFLTISILLVGYSISYKITKDFKNQKLVSFFGIHLFEMKMELDFPEYISVFSATYSLDNEWGFR